MIAKDNAELAYQFTAFAPRALALMDSDAVESWLLYAMDLYDKKGQNQWAQNWYGTWRGGVLLQAIESARLSDSDVALFHALEQVRLDACIARDFPGLQRDMAALRRELDDADPDWGAISGVLGEIGADVADSLRLTAELRGRHPLACCYRGDLDPLAVRSRVDIRAALERDRFRIALAKDPRRGRGHRCAGGCLCGCACRPGDDGPTVHPTA